MRRRLLIIGLVAIIIVVLTILLQGFVRETIAPAILYTVWRLGIMLGGIPQVLIWAFFVALVPVFAIFSLVWGRPSREEEAPPPPTMHPGRVQVLTQRIWQTTQGSYFKMRLNRYLANLALETVGYRQRLTPQEAKEMLHSGQLEISPQARAYLEKGWRRRLYEAPADTLRKRLARRVRALFNDEQEAVWYDPQMDKLIEFLEAELEVEGDS